MRPKHIVMTFVLLALVLPAPPAYAEGVVTVCDEAHLLAALAGGGTVTFACSGVITLTATITVAADTTIDGSGQDVTISGNDAVGVFHVNPGTTLNLNRLTVANGWADDGGGVYNAGTLTVTHCALTGNDAYNTDNFGSGGAIFNAGSAIVSDSILTGNSARGANGSGGAIANTGTLIVRRSAFSNNEAQDFGGAIVGNDLTVSDSTFDGNRAPVGGAICSSNQVESCIFEGSNANGGDNLTVSNSSFLDNTASFGGGIYFLGNPNARLAVHDSDFANNSASEGGSIYSHGSAMVSDSAFSHNTATGDGGAIWVNGVATVSDSLFASNNALQRGGAIWSSGTLTVSDSIFTSNSAYGADFGTGGALSNNGTMTVRNSTFTGNSAQDFGGAIHGSNLSIDSSTFVDNSALVGGAIAGSGLVENCTFEGNSAPEGGAIYSSDWLTVNNSSFVDNNSALGGGIGYFGDGAYDLLTVRDSTFSGNTSTGEGGGLLIAGTATVAGSTFIGNSAAGAGGGVYSSSGSGAGVAVSNSTFVDNSANHGGGIYVGYGALTVSNSTLSGNNATGSGGGIYTAGGALTLKNTVVAHSPAGGNCSGTITDGGSNVSYPDTSCPGINADPLLGPLQDNGGPTWTMALGEGSAALDAGIDLTCVTAPVNGLDQRGVVRPQGAHCDSGAVEESQEPVVTLVEVCDEAHLRPALASGGTLMFTCSGVIPLATEIVIAANVTIDGSGQDVTISGNHAVRVFRVDPGWTLSLRGLDIVDGTASLGGAIYVNTGVVNVSDCAFLGHTGEAIVNEGGALAVSQSTFSSNNGCAIHSTGSVDEARLTVNDTTFSGNGCGISNDWGTATVSNSTFSANSGRGMGNAWGTATVSNSVFSSNSGGGIDNYFTGEMTVRDSVFSGNSADQGGGVYNYGDLEVSNSTFLGNSATYGGAIYTIDRWLLVTDSTFSDNSAIYGGAIWGLGGFAVRDCTFISNHAEYGGGIDSIGGFSVSSSTFSGNHAVYQGGGIRTCSLTASVSNSTFSGNHADAGGGNYNYCDGTFSVTNSSFSGNTADSGGGGIYNASNATCHLKNTIVANSPSGGNCAGAITDGGGNLSYPDTTCPGINVDPMLGPLQNNGGTTWTMALGEGSAAIDAADDAICAAPPVNNLDQRGFVRPWGAHCDIGAVEQVQEPVAVRLSTINAGSTPGAVAPTAVVALLLLALGGCAAWGRRQTQQAG